MFNAEEFYKLYNCRCEGKYTELTQFLEHFCQDMQPQSVTSGKANGKEKGFRNRMGAYSRTQAQLLLAMVHLEARWTDEYRHQVSLSEMQKDQETFYGDLYPETYAASTLNPAYMSRQAGRDLGPILALFATILRGGVKDAYLHRRFMLLKRIQLYFELHKRLLHGQVRADDLSQLLTRFLVENGPLFLGLRFEEHFNPMSDWISDILAAEDLSELYYLYELGLPVTDDALCARKCLAEGALDEVRPLMQMAASHLHEALNVGSQSYGYRASRPRKNERTLVGITAALGTEAAVKVLCEELREKGYTPLVSHLIPTGMDPRVNQDHQADLGVFASEELEGKLKEWISKLNMENEALLRGFAGTIRMETVSETEAKGKNLGQADRLENLSQALKIDSMIKEGFGDYPEVVVYLPQSADEETWKQNLEKLLGLELTSPTLPERTYSTITNIVDSGYAVYIKGREGNETDLTVGLKPLENAASESNARVLRLGGCLPGGEIRLMNDEAGTFGTLHVKNAMLNGKHIQNLKISFEDGEISALSFDGAAQGETAGDYRIVRVAMGFNPELLEKLDELAAESKLRTYFEPKAGLTLRLESHPIVSAAKRLNPYVKKTVSEVYQETDRQEKLFIPYEELALLSVIKDNDQQTDIVREGMFVPVGTDALNMILLKRRQVQSASAEQNAPQA